MPVTFYNWSHRGGEVNQLRLIIGRPDNSLNYCDIIWANFAQIIGDEVRLRIDTQGIAQPIAIPAQSSVTKMIRFNWGPTETPLDIQPGEYELIVYGWTEEKDKPNLSSKVSFLLNEAICKVYEKHVSDNLIAPIPIALGDMRLPNNTFTRKGVFKTYEG